MDITNSSSDTNSAVFAAEQLNKSFTYTSEAYNNVSKLSEDVYNSSISSESKYNETQLSTVFEAFIISEIVMTATELALSTVAALKISRWRNNYRNQMLMQLSLARFVKRIIFLIEFMKDKVNIDSSPTTKTLLTCSQMYIDFVIVILVCFFIKHMYDSLIIVIVKISKFNLYSVICYSWLLPVPISMIWTAVIVTKLLSEWTAYFSICLVFRWPLILLGTVLYLTILFNVLMDKIRKFARSLTIVTFLLCLLINFYLISKDIIKLWCIESFTTVLISYISGFLLNFFILCFYIILIILSFRNNTRSCNMLPELSTANVLR